MKTNLKYLISLTVIAVSFQSFSQENWTLIYHNDQNGKALSGSIDKLREAALNGEEIRIGWGSSRVKHIADVKFFTIMQDSIVFAQIDPIIGQTPNFETGEIMFKENLEWSFIGGSNGKMTVIMRNVITGEILSHRVRSSPFKWFIGRK